MNEHAAVTRLRAPKISANADEATVTAWFKAEGDAVRAGEALLELTTDKTAAEIEAPADGLLRRIAAPVKSVVPVGYVLALVGAAEADLPDIDMENQETMQRFRNAASAGVATDDAAEGTTVRATPGARRLARARGVELADVQRRFSARIVSEKMVREYAS